jgi:anti-anti-sigma factor
MPLPDRDTHDRGGITEAADSGQDPPRNSRQAKSDQNEMPRLWVREYGELTIVEIMNAELQCEPSAVREISRALHRLVNEGCTRLLVNLGGVRSISAEVVAMIAGLIRELHNQHGRLELYGVEPLIREMLTICHLDPMVEIHADEPEAFAETIADD